MSQSAPPRGLTRDLGPFLSDVKCCTFHPFLPSFTLGALLLEVEEGRLGSSVFETYLRASRLDPLGAHSVRKPTSVCETGKRVADRCPFSAEGRCGIHAFRPSTCAAYVCRSSLGARGHLMWRKWESRLAEFEWTLAHEVAFEQGYTLDDIRDVFANQQEAEKFYRRSYEIARGIDIDRQFGLNGLHE